MRAREKVWSTKLRTLGGGATLSLALLAFGCGGSTPVVTPPVELPPVARNLLNTDDLAPPTVREGGPLSPTRPVRSSLSMTQLPSQSLSCGQMRPQISGNVFVALEISYASAIRPCAAKLSQSGMLFDSGQCT